MDTLIAKKRYYIYKILHIMLGHLQATQSYQYKVYLERLI